MSTTEEMKTAFQTFVDEDAKFTEKGNAAAGTRARKALMELTKLAKARRTEIQTEKNAKKD